MPTRLFELRRSTRHGRGAFAVAPIPRYTPLIEYTGEIIHEDEGERRYPVDDPGNLEAEHTFLLALDETRVIDANVGGNAARFINHSCEPNCEPIRFGDRIWICAIRPIRVGEELAYDYAIELDVPHTPEEKRRFPCFCGAKTCRGSILKPKAKPWHPLVRAAHRHFAKLAAGHRATLALGKMPR